jgi:hypothetical protein
LKFFVVAFLNIWTSDTLIFELVLRLTIFCMSWLDDAILLYPSSFGVSFREL